MKKATEIIQKQVLESLRKLEGQEGSKLELYINRTVALRGGKNPIRRDMANEVEVVDLAELTHVSVAVSENHGMCVRLVIKQQMYATCGEDADMIVTWAEVAGATMIRQKIGKFPKVYFQKVVGNIVAHGEELVLA